MTKEKFNRYLKPSFTEKPPEQEIVSSQTIWEETFEEGDIVPHVPEGTILQVSYIYKREYEYDYEDNSSVTLTCVKVTRTPNTNYQVALDLYNKAKEAYEKELADWNMFEAERRKEVNRKQSQTREQNERDEYERLKKKFEK